MHAPTLEKIVAWARSGAHASRSRRRSTTGSSSSSTPTGCPRLQLIGTIEGELAELLVQTPYVLLLGIPGSTWSRPPSSPARWGRSEHYAKARAITGRAGLFPSRYQSDQVDHRDGALVRHANRDLRHAILMIADNLIKCNDHFRVLAAGWRLKGKDPRDIHVKVAGRFCRIAYQMVAGGMTFRHPCSKQRDYILHKLIRFSLEHDYRI